MASLATFLRGDTEQFAAQTRRQIDGVPDDSDDGLVNMVELLSSVSGLMNLEKDDAFTLVGGASSAVVDPAEDEIEQSMRAFLRDQRNDSAPTSINEMSHAQIVEGLRTGKVLWTESAIARAKNAALTAKQVLHPTIGYKDINTEGWLRALIAEEECRMYFARLVVSQLNYTISRMSSVNSTARQYKVLEKQLARDSLRLISQAETVRSNLERQSTGGGGVPTLV